MVLSHRHPEQAVLPPRAQFHLVLGVKARHSIFVYPMGTPKRVLRRLTGQVPVVREIGAERCSAPTATGLIGRGFGPCRR